MIDIQQVGNSLGLFGAVRQLGGTFLAAITNRLELASIEFKEEKSRLIAAAIWAGALVFLAVLSAIALMFTLAFVFWEQRVAVMGGFCGFFLVGTPIALFVLRAKIKRPPFTETITQLKKDRDWLTGR